MKSSKGRLGTIYAKATNKRTNIQRLQAKEYGELFPPTSQKFDRTWRMTHWLDRSPHTGLQADREWFTIWAKGVQGARSGQGNWRILQDGPKVDPTQLSARRGPPTDRPPDKPPPWKGASRRCLLERAGTRHVSQLASFTRGSYCLSGNATPLQKMRIEWCAPSNNSASHAAGSSHDSSA
jgi:hypothetical protein